MFLFHYFLVDEQQINSSSLQYMRESIHPNKKGQQNEVT